MENKMQDNFTYNDNAEIEKVKLFGYDWFLQKYFKTTTSGPFTYFHLKNEGFGEFYISKNALDSIKKEEEYKLLSLIYEQNINDKNLYYSITLSEEKDKLQWKYDNYISLSVEEIFSRFPSDFIEIQQRALINIYKQYPNYGQEVELINNYIFFVKNNSELFFILNSMKNKNWINVNTRKMIGGEFIFTELIINDNGWLEIEKTIKKNRKKQVFIAMKFKDMDNVYDSI